MGCGCKNKNKAPVTGGIIVSLEEAKSIKTEQPVFVAESSSSNVVEPDPLIKAIRSESSRPVEWDAIETDLVNCYLCTKKHIVRAQILHEEVLTGYPEHVRNLISSLKVAEKEVNEAFLKWQQCMGHLNMAEAELLGNRLSAESMNQRHRELANDIRAERLKVSEDPNYPADYDALLTKVHQLQFEVLG